MPKSKEDKLEVRIDFASLPFWGSLTKAEQTVVDRDTRGVIHANNSQVSYRVQMFVHLSNLQKVLEPKGLFKKYLEENLNFSYRTAYRGLEALEKVRQNVPNFALELAAKRGIDIVGYSGHNPFGEYDEPIKQLPPPKEADPTKVGRWLDRLEEAKKSLPRAGRFARRKKTVNPDTAVRMAFRGAQAPLKKVPSGKVRVTAVSRLLGLLMAEFGIPAQTISPEAVPDGFRPVLGRPRIKKTEARAQAS